MKKKLYERYSHPSTQKKIIEQVGIITSSSSQLEHYVELLISDDGHSDESPIDKELREEAIRVSTKTGSEQILAAFKLGQLHTLNTLIGEEVAKNKEKGSARKSKVWAYELAKQLVKDYPGSTNENLWGKIRTHHEYELSEDIGPLEMFRDGETLWAEDKNGKCETLAKSTFFTEYLSQARKNA